MCVAKLDSSHTLRWLRTMLHAASTTTPSSVSRSAACTTQPLPRGVIHVAHVVAVLLGIQAIVPALETLSSGVREFSFRVVATVAMRLEQRVQLVVNRYANSKRERTVYFVSVDFFDASPVEASPDWRRVGSSRSQRHEGTLPSHHHHLAIYELATEQCY